MRKRKGQFISMIVVFVLLLISGGTLFSAVLAQNTITGTVNYTSNDINQLLEAKSKVELYKYNVKKELNYSFNIVGREIGEDGGDLDWEKNIPSESQIRDKFEDNVLNHEYGIKGQNRLYGCSRPAITPTVFEIESEHNLQLDFANPSINCSATGTKAILPFEEEHDVINPKNNYLPMAYYAKTLADKVKNIAPDNLEDTASDTTSCEDSDQSATREDAKDSARSGAVSGHLDVASNAYSQTSGQRGSFITGTKDTSYEGTYEQIDYDSSDCSYTECSGSGEDRDCDTIDSTEYTYEYRWTADTLDAEYDLEDSNNQVMTENGLDRIKFEFTYVHELQ